MILEVTSSSSFYDSQQGMGTKLVTNMPATNLPQTSLFLKWKFMWFMMAFHVADMLAPVN